MMGTFETIALYTMSWVFLFMSEGCKRYEEDGGTNKVNTEKN